MHNIEQVIESLSANERKILPLIKHSIKEIVEKSGLDETSCLRALQFLSNKNIINLESRQEKLIDLGDNGVIYLKHGLPERRLLESLDKPLSLEEAQKKAKLSDNEFKAALGALKKKAQIELKEGKIHLTASKQEISKKSLEEQFLESLPLPQESLKPEQIHALKNLELRKDIVKIDIKSIIKIDITDLGNKILSQELKHDLIENLTSEMILNESWKGKKFRRYDIISQVPRTSGGKKHFVNQAIDYGRKIWTEMGFKEMSGNMVQTSFWNFDALFTPQDHPAREMQDTFFLNKLGKLPDKKILEQVKKSHEGPFADSKCWQYNWQEKIAERIIMRTHTTCLSAQTLAKLKQSDFPAKFFAIGKVFRNETVDWKHGFEFYQTEGIVVDKNATFKHLLGYLKEFYKKMGFEKVRFHPSFFPYTEPSVEIDVFHPERKSWLELGGAGIFRPEVSKALLGEIVPVLAWGQGFDRIILDYYQIQDLRELYKNDLSLLRKIKFWMK
jgi:phenylalanyl-tRNA synthetase alpha chain